MASRRSNKTTKLQHIISIQAFVVKTYAADREHLYHQCNLIIRHAGIRIVITSFQDNRSLILIKQASKKRFNYRTTVKI